jgi:hypothetical protein
MFTPSTGPCSDACADTAECKACPSECSATIHHYVVEHEYRPPENSSRRSAAAERRQAPVTQRVVIAAVDAYLALPR